MTDGINTPDLENPPPVNSLFKPGSWFAKIDFINHLVLFNNLIIAVLANKEGGKTSFSDLLQNNLDQQIKFYSVSAHASCTKQETIDAIATKLKLDEHPDLSSIAAFVNQGKAHILIIIDDAQNLPQDFIKEAMEVIKQQDDFGFFHLCFISDHSIVASLNALAINPLTDIIHTIELSSLNENETRTYVMQRLMNHKSIQQAPTDLQFKQFYQLTKGNVSQINTQLDSFVSSCSKKVENKKFFFLKCASILLCTVLVLKISFWHFTKKPPVNQGFMASIALPKRIIPLGESKIAPIVFKPSEEISQIPNWQLGSTQSELVRFDLPNNPLLDYADEENTSLALVDKVIVIPKIQFVNDKTHKLLGNQYTIQLLASHQAKELQALRRKNKLLADTKIKYFTNESGVWYILILGEYNNKADAKKHVKQLPIEIVKFNPWIRNMTGLEGVG